MKKTDKYVVWAMNKLLKLTSKEYQDKFSLIIYQGMHHNGPFISKDKE